MPQTQSHSAVNKAMATITSAISSWISYFFWAFLSVGIVLNLLYSTVRYLFAGWGSANAAFWGVFAFRNIRLLVHCIAFFCYRPAPEMRNPRYSAKDVTVVVPTITPHKMDFLETVTCICRNEPNTIIVVTVGQQNEMITRQSLALLMHKYPGINFSIMTAKEANKRAQIGVAARQIMTPITFLVDASVFWGPSFLTSALAAFEDASVYLVGTNKRVRVSTWDSLENFLPWGFMFNFFGSTYLGRHNFEIRATNTIDGGLFAVSGRTMGIRTAFLKDPKILYGFENERVSSVLGKFIPACNEPLLPDDDNYLTRQVINAGHKIKIQYTEDARVEIAPQFTYPRFLSQCMRWARSTYRSNCATMITERAIYRNQPWSWYAVYLNGMVNFALGCDCMLLYLFRKTTYNSRFSIFTLVAWIILSKLIKLIPYFIRNPRDLIFAPVYCLFAWYHSWIKLQALVTFYSADWAGRNLDAVNEAAATKD